MGTTMRSSVRWFVVATAAMTGTAAADALSLHSQDSITIDGTRYTCDDSSRKGVQLGPGDQITAGKYQLKCLREGAPAHDLAVQSRVDATCFATLNQVISGHPSTDDVIWWADACRPFEVGSSCSTVTTKPDDACYTAMNQTITATFSKREASQAQRACQEVDTTCPAIGTKVVSKVELACIEKLYSTTTGKPNGHAMIGWIESCRDHAIGSCVVVGGSFNRECVTKSFTMLSGTYSIRDAGAAARACRTLELRCQ